MKTEVELPARLAKARPSVSQCPSLTLSAELKNLPIGEVANSAGCPPDGHARAGRDGWATSGPATTFAARFSA